MQACILGIYLIFYHHFDLRNPILVYIKLVFLTKCRITFSLYTVKSMIMTNFEYTYAQQSFACSYREPSLFEM